MITLRFFSVIPVIFGSCLALISFPQLMSSYQVREYNDQNCLKFIFGRMKDRYRFVCGQQLMQGKQLRYR